MLSSTSNGDLSEIELPLPHPLARAAYGVKLFSLSVFGFTPDAWLPREGHYHSYSMGHFTAQRKAYMRGCQLRSRTWATAAIMLLLTPVAAQAQIVGVNISVAPGSCLSFWELMAFTPTGVNVAWNALGTSQSLLSQPDSSAEVGNDLNSSAELGNDLIARPYELGVVGYVSSSCSNALGDTWQVMWAQPQQIAFIIVINRADFSIVNAAVTLIGQNGLEAGRRLIISSSIIARLNFQVPVLWPVVPDLSNSTVVAQQNVSDNAYAK